MEEKLQIVLKEYIRKVRNEQVAWFFAKYNLMI